MQTAAIAALSSTFQVRPSAPQWVSLLAFSLQQFHTSSLSATGPVETLGLQQAATFVRGHPEELRRRAKAGQIPGAKVGRAWVFLEDDLAGLPALSLCSASASVASDTEKGDAMSLRKRGGVWWIDVYAANGERVRRTTGTANKALAQELHDRFKSELWRIGHLGDKPQHTWNEAVVHWLKEQSHKATASEDVTKLRWLDQFPGGKELEVLRAILRKCVARAKRDAIVRIAGVGRLGVDGDGAAVCASRRRSLGALCRTPLCVTYRRIGNGRHVYVTGLKGRRARHRQALVLLVAGAGFEPATFGL